MINRQYVIPVISNVVDTRDQTIELFLWRQQVSSLAIRVGLDQKKGRKDEVVLNCVRIGHTHSTHSYFLRKDPPPQFEHCQCILTVRNILVECNHFDQQRTDIFSGRDVVESLRFHLTLIVIFIKQTEFYINF